MMPRCISGFGTNAKCRDVRFRAAIGVITEVNPTSFEGPFDPQPTSISPSLNNLVGFRTHFGWDGYANSPSGLKVDYELVRQRRPYR
jgi:hypothetical protein